MSKYLTGINGLKFYMKSNIKRRVLTSYSGLGQIWSFHVVIS